MSAKRSIAILALLPAMLAAQQAEPRVKVVEPTQLDQSLPSISLLPVGAVLRDVMIPRYDRNRQLTSCLRSSQITLIDPDTIETRKVRLEFFGPERARRGFVDVLRATYNQKTGVLKSTEAVDIKTDRFSANGSGLHYHLRSGKGFLAGPVTTLSQGLAPQPSTSMKLSPKSTAAAVAAAAVIATSAHAEPPVRLTPEQRAVAEQASASKASEAKAAVDDARQEVTTSERKITETSNQAREFLAEAGVAVEPSNQPATGPLEVPASANNSRIQADDGMYFDAEKGVIVFLKNVRVSDARFDLTGAQELKIMLEPKAASAKDGKPKADQSDNADTPKSPGLFPSGASFGDVERVIATGQVRITMKGQNGQPDTEASAAVFNMNVKTGEILMHGGYPWVKQGTTFARAKQPDLYLRIFKNNSFVTEGQWDMGGALDGLQKEKDKKTKPAN